MAGKIIPFDFFNMGSQFESEMVMQQNPWNIFLSVNTEHQLVLLLQNHGKNELRFLDPDMMRAIAGFLTDYAGRWERGELPGLKTPGTSVTDSPEQGEVHQP